MLDRAQDHRAVGDRQAPEAARKVGLEGVHVVQGAQPDIDHEVVRARRDRAGADLAQVGKDPAGLLQVLARHGREVHRGQRPAGERAGEVAAQAQPRGEQGLHPAAHRGQGRVARLREVAQRHPAVHAEEFEQLRVQRVPARRGRGGGCRRARGRRLHACALLRIQAAQAPPAAVGRQPRGDVRTRRPHARGSLDHVGAEPGEFVQAPGLHGGDHVPAPGRQLDVRHRRVRGQRKGHVLRGPGNGVHLDQARHHEPRVGEPRIGGHPREPRLLQAVPTARRRHRIYPEYLADQRPRGPRLDLQGVHDATVEFVQFTELVRGTGTLPGRGTFLHRHGWHFSARTAGIPNEICAVVRR